MFVNKKRTAENNSPFLIWPILSDRYPIHFLTQNCLIGIRRKQLHLSQEKLAEMVDKSTVYISNLENGKRGASVESIIMICGTLGLGLDELLVGTVPEGTDEYLDMIASVFQQCTETEKRLISEVVIILFEVMGKYHQGRR